MVFRTPRKNCQSKFINLGLDGCYCLLSSDIDNCLSPNIGRRWTKYLAWVQPKCAKFWESFWNQEKLLNSFAYQVMKHPDFKWTLMLRMKMPEKWSTFGVYSIEKTKVHFMDLQLQIHFIKLHSWKSFLRDTHTHTHTHTRTSSWQKRQSLQTVKLKFVYGKFT